MNENENIFAIMHEAVRNAINEAANEAIKAHREQFEREMLKAKRQVVNELTNSIQIVAEHDLPRGEYVIQIRLNGLDARTAKGGIT